MRRMLIVEDERDLCELLQEFFTSRGFTVLSAFSGEEALSLLQQHTTDVILLDILLPGVSGIEVLKRAKDLVPHARIIMVTSLNEEEVRSTAFRHGACGYITKPFDFSDETWAVAFKPAAPSPPPPAVA